MKQVKRKFKDSKRLKEASDDYRQEFLEQKHSDYLENDEAYEYYFDMIFAQKYAQHNRRTMLKQIIKELNIAYDEDKVVESIHNYIDFNDFILRKGAIASYEGKYCIVSLNMRDGILLCEGKSNEH